MLLFSPLAPFFLFRFSAALDAGLFVDRRGRRQAAVVRSFEIHDVPLLCDGAYFAQAVQAFHLRQLDP